MKVLHVINTLRGGGAEMNVLRLALHANRARIEPHLAYCGSWPLECDIKGRGVPLFRLDESPRRVRSLATPRIIARLLAYIHRHDIDIVHTHLFNAHAWGAVAARLAHVKVLEHVHDHRYTDRSVLVQRGLAEMRQYDRAHYLARLSHHIVVLTNQNRDYVLERVRIQPANVSLIPNGLAQRSPLPAAEQRTRLRRSLGIPDDAHVLLGVGRLADEKNFKVLIAAVEQLHGQIPSLFATILGEGVERDALQRQIDRAGLTDVVRLAGHKADVQSYYDSADIFVQPSIFELQSLAMLEAMQSGLPAIVSQGVGCNDDMISHGESGFLVHPNRSREWAEAIGTLIRDPGLRSRVGAAGQSLVRRQCDIRHVSDRFESLYEELCST
jgi:glycosyltransferase involved in cell wall biosynthesis